ncbi:bypass of stop codon protein 6 [Diutina catenulata]
MKVIEYQDTEITLDSVDWRQSHLLKVQLAGCFALFLLCGIAEQTLGTMIPKLEAHYHLDDFQMSLTYVVVMTGYFLTGISNEFIHSMVGVRGVITGSVFCLTLAYFVNSLQPPYVIFALMHLFVGLGIGGLDSGINGWMGELVHANQLMGFLHGCYGLGCMISPPLVTYLVHHTDWRWYDYYFALSVYASLVLLVASVSFRYESPGKFAYIRQRKHEEEVKENGGDELAPVTIKDLARQKMAWLLAIALFWYLGGEVAFGSWLVSFFLRVKKLSYSTSSWVATSYWGGITSGRMVLGFVTAHYFPSATKATWYYLLGSAVAFATIAFVQFISGEVNWFIMGLDFASVYIAGFVAGPVFQTILMSVFDLLPARFHTAAMGVICAIGGGGGAVVPFVVGLVSRSTSSGLANMPVIVTIVYVLSAAVWTYIYTHRNMKL